MPKKKINKVDLKILKAVYDSLPDPLLVYNIITKKVIMVNQTAVDFTGFTKKELEGKKIVNVPVLFKEDIPFLMKKMKARAQNKPIPPYELRMKKKDGTVIYLDISGKLARDGFRLLALISFRDITKRVTLSRGIKMEKEKFEKYINLAGVIMLALDAKGNIFYINKKGCEILGFNYKDHISGRVKLIGKNWFTNFLPQRIRKKIKGVFNKLMMGKIKSVEQYENPILRRDGKERVIFWQNAVLRDEKGRTTGTLASGTDITKLKQASKQLAEKVTQLEKLNTLMVGRELKMAELKKKLGKKWEK